MVSPRQVLPALMPKRLWLLPPPGVAISWRPQPVSSAAWARISSAGTPEARLAARAGASRRSRKSRTWAGRSSRGSEAVSTGAVVWSASRKEAGIAAVSTSPLSSGRRAFSRGRGVPRGMPAINASSSPSREGVAPPWRPSSCAVNRSARPTPRSAMPWDHCLSSSSWKYSVWRLSSRPDEGTASRMLFIIICTNSASNCLAAASSPSPGVWRALCLIRSRPWTSRANCPPMVSGAFRLIR